MAGTAVEALNQAAHPRTWLAALHALARESQTLRKIQPQIAMKRGPDLPPPGKVPQYCASQVAVCQATMQGAEKGWKRGSHKMKKYSHA